VFKHAPSEIIGFLYGYIYLFDLNVKRLKTYLRNKTGEEILNGLTLLNVHRDIIEVNCEDILNIVAKTSRN